MNGFLRVGDAACTTACGADDTYRLRVRETTISVARFNNTGAQITVLLTQNTTDETINSTFFYWSVTGTLLQTGALTSPPKSLNVFNTSSFGPLAGVGGSITIAHDGPYGGLNVKSVALEPSTGFSFDTPGVFRGYESHIRTTLIMPMGPHPTRILFFSDAALIPVSSERDKRGNTKPRNQIGFRVFVVPCFESSRLRGCV